jgi:ABC-type phosphate transport system substrate-binding protein
VKTCRSTFLLLLVAVFSVPSFAHHMAVVVAADNSATNLTSVQLGKIFRTETKKWPDGRNIVLILHRASTGETITLQHLNKMTAAQFQAWSNEHRDQVKFVDSDQDMLTAVQATPGAVGLVDVRAVNDKVKVLHVDGKLPLEDGYLPH